MANEVEISIETVKSARDYINELTQTLPEAEIFNGAISSLHDILDITCEVWNTEGGSDYVGKFENYLSQLDCASEVESLNSKIKASKAEYHEIPHSVKLVDMQ